MTLQASGQLSMSQINSELRRSSTSQISLDTAENGGYGAINQNSLSRPNPTNPAYISEWYGYNHTAQPSETINHIYTIDFAPEGGSCTITNNGVRIIRTSTTTQGSFTSVVGDAIRVTISPATGGTRGFSNIRISRGSNTIVANSSSTTAIVDYTVTSGVPYDIEAIATNDQ